MPQTVALPKVGRSYRIWKVVEQLVLENYGRLSEKRMRGTYYLIRERLDLSKDRLEELLAEQVSVMAVDVRPIQAPEERDDQMEKPAVPAS